MKNHGSSRSRRDGGAAGRGGARSVTGSPTAASLATLSPPPYL